MNNPTAIQKMRQPSDKSINPSPLDDNDLEQIDRFQLTHKQEKAIAVQARKARHEWIKRLLRQLLPKAMAAYLIFGEENAGKTYYLIYQKTVSGIQSQRKSTSRGMTQGTEANRRTEINKALKAIGIPDNLAEAALFPTETYQQMNLEKDSIQEQKSGYRFSTEQAEALVALAESLLDSEAVGEIFAGLAPLIGRRNGEILSAGFSKASNYSISAWSLSKSLHNTCIEIPTLIESQKILSAIASVREKCRATVNELLDEHDDDPTDKNFRAKLNKTFKHAPEAARSHFFPLMQQWEIAPQESSDIYSHLFRGFYAAIAQLYFFPGNGTSEINFRSYIQGHFARSGSKISATDRNNYDRFFCSDRTEGAKGIKLDEWDVSPLNISALMTGVRENNGFGENFPFPETTINPPTRADTTSPQKRATTKGQADESQRSTSEESPELAIGEIESETEATTKGQADESQRSTSKESPELAIEEIESGTEATTKGQADEPQRSTDSEQKQRSLREIESLKERLDKLEQAVYEQNGQPGKTEGFAGDHKLQSLEAHNAELLQKLAQTSALLKQKDAQIQTLKQVLNTALGLGTIHIEPEATPQAQPELESEIEPELEPEREQETPAQNTSENDYVISAPKAMRMGRRARLSEDDYSQVFSQFLSAIKDFNSRQENSLRRYYLSLSSMMKVLRFNNLSAPQDPLKTFCDRYKEELRDHNQSFGISQKGNDESLIPISVEWVSLD